MHTAPISKQAVGEKLCLSCGLCCNGAIFRDVKLLAGADAGKLESLGLPISPPGAGRGAPHFPQPCAALSGCRCRIYSDRPTYCRRFECALFKSVMAGRTQPAAASRAIQGARRCVGRVRRLIRRLGDTDETASLRTRFRRITERLAQSQPDQASAQVYGELTLAMHDLNLLLSQKFYPGDAR